jgi:hypothetical protein
MRLVNIMQASATGTPLGAFLGALMRRFDLPKLLRNLSRSDMQSNYGKFGNWTKKVKAEVLGQLLRVEKICRQSGLTAESSVKELRERIGKDEKHILNTLGTQIAGIRNDIVRQMERLIYLEIPQSNVALFDPEEPLFGQLVYNNFKSSRYDISEAGKCLALDRSTACVMHSMRALEPGLIATSKKAGFIPTRDDWGTIIDGIETRLTPTNVNYIKDKKTREFLRPAATQFRHFKDAWRNHAMHAREKYTSEEAESIFRSVKSFMMQIAKRLKE